MAPRLLNGQVVVEMKAERARTLWLTVVGSIFILTSFLSWQPAGRCDDSDSLLASAYFGSGGSGGTPLSISHDETHSPQSWALGLAAGVGELNSTVARTIPSALNFNPTATTMVGASIGASDPTRLGVDHGEFVFVSPQWVQGSLKWFGDTSVARNCDVSDCDLTHGLPAGFEFSPLNLKFLESPDRGYLIVRPSLTAQGQLLALRAGPMAGAGYGLRPDSDAHLAVPFAGFDVGLDGKLSSAWFTGRKRLRIQSGASVDAYEDLTGHLGQVATSGRLNNDTMTGVAYFEVVSMVGRADELALGWKGTYDRLTPYDPSAGRAARNEDTMISIYLRWSGGANVGSPALGGGV